MLSCDVLMGSLNILPGINTKNKQKTYNNVTNFII